MRALRRISFRLGLTLVALVAVTAQAVRRAA